MSEGKKRNWLSLLIKSVLFLMLMVLLLIAMLHLPSVQNFIAKKAASQIVDSSQGHISFETCSFDLHKGVNMHDIHLRSIEADTLLSIRELTISPRRTLLALINHLEFSDLNLVGVTINYKRKDTDDGSNWSRFTNKINNESAESDDDNKPFPLSHVELYELSINYDDDVDSIYIDGNLAGLEIKLNSLDGNLIDIDFINIIEPQLNIVRYNSTPRDAEESAEVDTTQGPSIPVVSLDRLNIINGQIVDSHIGAVTSVDDIDFVLSDIGFDDLHNWRGTIDDISFKTDDIHLRHWSSNHIENKDDHVIVEDLFVRVGDSYVSLDAEIEDIGNVTSLEDVSIKATVIESGLVLSDFLRFLPDLDPKILEEPLINKHSQLTGTLSLQSGDLYLDQLKLWLNGRHYLHADGTMTSIDDLSNSLVNLEIVSLQTDLARLDSDIKMINISKELKRLGSLNFSGTFDGFLNDFIAQGKLDSDLGTANMDIQFDLYRSDIDTLAYAGYLDLVQFDLARLLQQDDFGPVSLSLDINSGRGLDMINSSAKIEAQIEEFWYKGVSYHDAIYVGQLSSKTIDGRFSLSDPNAEFTFAGLVDLSDEEPIYDFDIKANKIDFCKLNLTDFPCSLRLDAEIDFRGNSVSSMQGSSMIKDIYIGHDTSELYIEQLSFRSNRMADNKMSFAMQSDFVDLELLGAFNVTKIHESLVGQLINKHKEHFEVFNKSNPFEEYGDDAYTATITTKNMVPLLDFFNVDIDVSSGTSIMIDVNKDRNKSALVLNSDSMSYQNSTVEGLYLRLDSQQEIGELEVVADQFYQGSRAIDKISWVAHIRDNDLFSKALINIDPKNHIEIETKSQVVDKGYYTQFLYDDLLMDSVIWTILPNKGVGVYKKALDIENLIITDGRRSIGIKDIYRRGLELSLKEFDFEVINPIIDYDKLYFDGTVDAQIKLNNIYEQLSIEGYLNVPDFTINEADYGKLSIESTRRTGNILDLKLAIEKDAQNLYVNGTANIDSQYVDTHLTMQQYPLAFLEYIIDDGISETTGKTNIELDIYGTFDDLKMRGQGRASNAGTKIDYIGAYYQLSDDIIPITERYIDLSNIVLTDEAGNTAAITGGLRHNVLADFRSDLTINSPRFIALNTTEEDNPIYYGLGMGPIDVSFRGPFESLDMKVDAIAGPSSLLYIPITSTSYGYDESFMNFNLNRTTIDSNTVERLVERLKSSGLDFEMNLTFDRDAEVQIIYDQETSNVLIGRGQGDLQIKVKRDGEFTAYGQYNVESGEYLYTSYGFIAKPFIIEQGGTVTWTGDPVNAVLDVRAYYPSLRAPLNQFLQEYEGVYPDVSDSELRQRRNIDLDLILTGNLFNPSIDFDLGFPDLVGNLKTLADSKVRALKSTENGINNQVLGLMVFNNFLPDNDPLANIQVSNWAQLGGNTITEFLTSQLSLMATEYLSDLLEGDVITGIDLDIALAQNNTIGETGVPNPDAGFIEFVPDEVQLNLRNEFKNDNFVLNLGGNYVRENPLNTVSDYLTGDFSLDWYITSDKRLKLQFYGVYDLDEASFGRRQKYGFGINYTREFGKMSYHNIEGALEGVSNEIRDGRRTSAGGSR